MSDIGRPLSESENVAYHYHIGATMRAWAHLEFTLMFYLQILLITDQWRSRAVWLSLPNFRARSTLVSRLIETFVNDDGAVAEWRAIAKRLKVMASHRNLLAHAIGGNIDTWSHHVFISDVDDDRGPMKFSRRKRMTAKSIEKWPGEMQKLRSDLGDFLRERIEPNMQASPRKSPQQPLE